jgi:glutamyl-tRNA reductase
VVVSVVTGVSVAHDRASVDEIEAAGAGEVDARLAELLDSPAVQEAFAVETCNRAEAYVVTADPESGRAVLADVLPALRDEAVSEMGHEESLRHLLRVASGLESLVLGEDQILGQLRTAAERARGAGALGPTLEQAVEKALHVGERARTETAINDGAVSLASAAVDLAEEEHGLDGATGLVVGAGEMGTRAARALADGGVERVVVANRTVPHARHVAAELAVDADAVGLEELDEVLAAADVLVAATGAPDAVVDRAALTDAGETYTIDIAQPRDVAPGARSLPGVTLRDIDDLESVTERTRERRRAAADAVERMVDEEFEHLLERYKRKRADDVIAKMYEGAEYVKRSQVEQAVSKLAAQRDGDLSAEEREVVESMAESLVGQLLAAPTRSLRDAAAEDDWTTINTAIELFDPEFGGDHDYPPSGDGEGVAGVEAGED